MFELSFSARNVLAGACLLGVAGGVLGSFAVLRRQSLLSDALAHAALPGVCIAFLITGSKSPGVLLVGALATGLVGALAILGIVRSSRIKNDSGIALILSVFFGAGVVLLTRIQHMPAGNQSGLDKFLFGQAAALLPRDIALMAVVVAVVLATVTLFYKELKLVCFDREYAASIGLPVRAIAILLTTLLVVVVVIGLQTVGVVLVVATLITPAAAARQWTERLSVMLVVAAAIGASSGAVGALLSASIDRMPTGPVIVLASSAMLIVSLLFGVRRGLLWAAIRDRRTAWRIRRENVLRDLYRWAESKGGDWYAPVPFPVIGGLRGQSAARVRSVAARLAARGLLRIDAGGLRFTERGLYQAESIVRKHRLWESYLTRRLELASDHVHRDADLMEHALDESAVALLEERLGYPEVDPHGQPIPPRREEVA